MFNEEDISQINERERVPDFLQENHLVVDHSIGRAHIVIHVTGRHRRLGIQIQDEITNLHDCLEIKFDGDSIQRFVKCSSNYQEELRNNLSGIIKLRKNPNLKSNKVEKNLKKLVL